MRCVQRYNKYVVLLMMKDNKYVVKGIPMSKTPEGRVKDKIKKVLKNHGIWNFLPVSAGYGKHGIPDFICCAPVVITPQMVGARLGMFLGIEAKATAKHEPTKRQAECMAEIYQASGATLVVNKDNINRLESFLRRLG